MRYFTDIKRVQNDTKFVQYDAKVLQKDANIVPNDAILSLFLPQRAQRITKEIRVEFGWATGRSLSSLIDKGQLTTDDFMMIFNFSYCSMPGFLLRLFFFKIYEFF